MLNAPTRTNLRRLAVAMTAAVIAGTVLVLGLSAALDLTWDPRATVILGLAAVWIPQPLLAANRRRR